MPAARDPQLLAEAIVFPSFNLPLVALSCLVSVAAAYVALRLIGHIVTRHESRLHKIMVLAAAASLGGGIWASRLLSVLSISAPLHVTFEPLSTLLSFAALTAVCGFAIAHVYRSGHKPATLYLSGAFMGLLIAGTQFVELTAIRGGDILYYRSDLPALSVALAIFSGVAILVLGRKLSLPGVRHGASKCIGASLIIGLALSGSTYAELNSTVFPAAAPSSPILDNHLMVFGVTMIMLVTFFTSLIVASADENLDSKKRVGMLVMLLSMIALAIGGTVLLVLYGAAFREQSSRLVEIAQSEARLIEAMGRFESEQNPDATHSSSFAATLAQVREAHDRFAGFGETGEFNLGRLKNGRVEFLFTHRHHASADTESMLVSSFLAEPMRRALEGQSGTMIGLDYRGEKVLAAYEPVALLNLGIVTKLDLAELRAPFVRAGIWAAGATVILVLLGVAFSFGIGDPLLRQLEDNERLEIELNFARSVQRGLLRASPPVNEHFRCAAAAVPARYVGGDFYDFAGQNDGCIGIVLGDVSGKGVSAALYMAQVLSDFRSISKLDPHPQHVLTEMNSILSESAKQGTFATMVYLQLDVPGGVMRIGNAGHHPVSVRRRSGGIFQIGAASGPPLGVESSSVYEVSETTTSDIDAVLIYTDGIVEARNSKGETFGLERLHSLFSQRNLSPEGFVEKINRDIRRFAGKVGQFDDMSLVVLSFS